MRVAAAAARKAVVVLEPQLCSAAPPRMCKAPPPLLRPGNFGTKFERLSIACTFR